MVCPSGPTTAHYPGTPSEVLLDSNIMRTDWQPRLAHGMTKIIFVFAAVLLLVACARRPQFDIVLRNGRICDGAGGPCVSGGIAINGDTIAKVGDLAGARGRTDL